MQGYSFCIGAVAAQVFTVSPVRVQSKQNGVRLTTPFAPHPSPGLRRNPMVQFSCDSCQAIKSPDETWILGLAAEAVGFTAARREVNILSGWDYTNAVHPLAVHFCS